MGISLHPAILILQANFGGTVFQYFTFSRISGSILTLFGAWLAIRWTTELLESLSRRSTRARFFIKWLEPVTRITFWFAAIMICFNLLAPSRETFLAGIASLGIALGLGAQDLVKNLVGGIVVLADRPYQLGDRVRIGDAYGEIDHIGLRSTKLTTPDDTRVTIPNAQVLTDRVFNANSGVPDCQVVTDLFLTPDTDTEMVLRVGYEAAICSPFLLATETGRRSGVAGIRPKAVSAPAHQVLRPRPPLRASDPKRYHNSREQRTRTARRTAAMAGDR